MRPGNALHEALFNDVRDGLSVLVRRDGVALTDEQLDERATNIVAGLVGNYEIRQFPVLGRPAGKPAGHSWSCRCDRCDTHNRSVEAVGTQIDWNAKEIG